MEAQSSYEYFQLKITISKTESNLIRIKKQLRIKSLVSGLTTSQISYIDHLSKFSTVQTPLKKLARATASKKEKTTPRGKTGKTLESVAGRYLIVSVWNIIRRGSVFVCVRDLILSRDNESMSVRQLLFVDLAEIVLWRWCRLLSDRKLNFSSRLIIITHTHTQLRVRRGWGQKLIICAIVAENQIVRVVARNARNTHQLFAKSIGEH